MKGFWHLVIAYGSISLFLGLYLVYLNGKMRDLGERIKRLENQ